MDELSQAFSRARQTLAVSRGGTFVSSDFDQTPRPLQSADIVVLRRYKVYDSYSGIFRIDCPYLCTTARGAEGLGLLAASMLFASPGSSIDVALPGPSDFRTIRLRAPEDLDERKPTEFCYEPRVARRYPWSDEVTDPWSLPTISLTTSDEVLNSDDDFVRRDVLAGFGTVSGTARMACLLLDLSQPNNRETEVTLEIEGGIRGVSPLSAELRIVLPGSLLWPEILEN